MGRQCGDREAARDWPPKTTLAFLQILSEKVEHHGNRRIKGDAWREIDEEMVNRVGGNPYGSKLLKGKYNRLRIIHREFSQLISHIGVKWNPTKNTVSASKDVWHQLSSKGKNFKSFQRKGCHHYELLGQIFGKTNVANSGQDIVNREALNPADERELFDPAIPGDANDGVVGEGSNSHSLEEAPSECLVLDGWIPGRDKERGDWPGEFQDCVNDLAGSLSSRNKARVVEEERKKNEARVNRLVGTLSDPFSIDCCIAILDGLEGVSTSAYNRALNKFIFADWRKIFVLMSYARRREWIDNLGDPFSIDCCMDILNGMDGVCTSAYNRTLNEFLLADRRKTFVLMSDERRMGLINSL